MSHASFEDAVRVLRNRMSGRWDGAEVDGRDAMIDALKSDLGYSSHQAKQVIDELAEAGLIRYHRSRPDTDGREETGAIVDDTDALTPGLVAAGAAGLGSGGVGGSSTGGVGAAAAAPLAIGALSSGFWEIGDPGSDTTGTEKAPMEGRAGQIDPTS